MFIVVVNVFPNAGRTEWIMGSNGRLKLFLKSSPEKGAANKELIRLIAKQLNLTQRDILVIAGLTHRRKRIRIDSDMTHEIFFQAIGLSIKKA